VSPTARTHSFESLLVPLHRGRERLECVTPPAGSLRTVADGPSRTTHTLTRRHSLGSRHPNASVTKRVGLQLTDVESQHRNPSNAVVDGIRFSQRISFHCNPVQRGRSRERAAQLKQIMEIRRGTLRNHSGAFVSR
jgi:hypothetical protein